MSTRNNGPYSVTAHSLSNLAQCSTSQSVLEHLANIITGKGVDLCSIQVLSKGQSREWMAPRNSTRDPLSKIETHMEGGRTNLTIVFAGSINPGDQREIEAVMQIAAMRIELCERRLWSEKEKPEHIVIDGIIGDSEPIRALRRSIRAAASCDSTTLITGESGTGKELAAQAIHNLGSRKVKPFIAVNCGAFTEALLESELFGYVKGAFTGALTNRKGLFEAAHRGTIFLDEIGEMPLAMQVKLLRVLQERKVRPVGAHEETDIDVRVIAATNRDLRREVAERRFREDLFYRLHVLAIRMPSLREHPADIAALTQHFLKTIQQRLKRAYPVEIEEAAVQALSNYHWPGNVRELENTIERLVAETQEGRVITVEQVRTTIGAARSIAENVGKIQYDGVLHEGESLDEHLDRQQLKIYEMVLAQSGGNHSQAARRLGIDRTALYHRLERARRRLSENRRTTTKPTIRDSGSSRAKIYSPTVSFRQRRSFSLF